MKKGLVIDTNKLLSALITPKGKTASQIISLSSKYQLFACHYLYIEIFHHKEKILKLSKLPEPELLELLLGILNRIDFVSEIHIAPSIWLKAESLTSGKDLDDTAHVALAIHLNLPLWSGDEKLKKHLISQNFDLIFENTPNL
jgi:predicted nucleic acid-binding protein